MCERNHDCVICRCEEVLRSEIEYAIEHGADSMNGIKRRTRAGMGFCQGKTCRKEVARILAEKKGVPISEIDPSTYRSPVRPMDIDIMLGDYQDGE